MRQVCEMLSQHYFLRLSEFPPQCEKFKIYLSFRFHVKSNSENLKFLPKLPFWAMLGALNFVNLVNLSLQKVQQYNNSEPLNVLKRQILHFQIPQNCFHVNSEGRKIRYQRGPEVLAIL